MSSTVSLSYRDAGVDIDAFGYTPADLFGYVRLTDDGALDGQSGATVGADIDDVVQTSYLRIWRKRAAEPIRSAKAFLFTIARHLALDAVRREHRSPIEHVGELAGLNVLDEQASVSDYVSRTERIQLLVEAIDALPPRCREVMILR